MRAAPPSSWPRLAAAVLAASPLVARAAGWDVRLEAGVQGHLASTQQQLYPGAGGNGTLRGAYAPLRFLEVHLAIGVMVWAAPPGADRGELTLGLVGMGARVRRPWTEGAHVSPWLDFDLDYARYASDNRFAYSIGAGLAVALDEGKRFRLGPFVRFTHVVTPDDRRGLDPTDPMIIAGGLSFEYGSGAPPRLVPDRDGDGIPDDHDRCPDQPEDKDGLRDEDGCPEVDQDADGVPDVDDRCPSVAGIAREHGCPESIPDRDGDGIMDSADQCPDVAGAVENKGCPKPAPPPEGK